MINCVYWIKFFISNFQIPLLWQHLCRSGISKMVFDLCFVWRNWLGKYSSNIWNLAPLCLLRCILREHNCCTFDIVDSSENQLLASFSGYWFDCSWAWGLTSCDSIPLFISSLPFCNYLSVFFFSSFYTFWLLCVFPAYFSVFNIFFLTYPKK